MINNAPIIFDVAVYNTTVHDQQWDSEQTFQEDNPLKPSMIDI